MATGSRTLKDAINEAFRDWVATVENTHYCLGSVMGPHPFPVMVRDFPAGDRRRGPRAGARRRRPAPRTPSSPCVGGGSNAIGAFHAFIPDDGVRPDPAARPGGGLASGRRAATLAGGSAGVIHGMPDRYLARTG